MKFSVDIEVVGERCRRKGEPRPPRGHNVTTASHSPSAPYGAQQRPGTPEDELHPERLSLEQRPSTGKLPNGGVHISAKNRRPASMNNRAYASSSSSWRRTSYYGQEKPVLRGADDDDRGSVSRGEVGMKVRICYVDRKGRVNATPRSVPRLGRAFSSMASDRELQGFVNQHHPDSDRSDELCGWESTVSITSLVDRLYPKRAAFAMEKAFFTTLDKGCNSVDFCGNSHLHPSDSCAEEDVLKTASTVTSMPSIQPSRAPKLAGSESSSSGSHSTHASKVRISRTAHSAVPRMTNSNFKCAADLRMTNSDFKCAADPRMTNSNFKCAADPSTINNSRGVHSATTAPVSNPRDSYSTSSRCSISSDRHPYSVPTNGTEASAGSPMAGGKCVRHVLPSEGCPSRPLTMAATKRVHFSVQDSVKEGLRSSFFQRRGHSATSGGRRWPSGSDGVTYSRLRGRRKTAVLQPKDVAKDENAPPPVSRMFRKFRMVGFIAVTLIRLKAAIVINSLDRTERSAAEIQWRTLYGEQEAEKLAFNKSFFSRERISTKMPRWALRVFEVAPEDRTEQDCRRLHALFRGMRSFEKFTEEIQLYLCRAISYSCVGESRIVLRRGHIGHNFYFIYSGSVFVNVQDTDSDGVPFIKTEAILGRGDSFGELALLQDIRRTATVSVRETCELLVVDKDVFSKVCPRIFEKELMEKKNFISRLSLFSPKWWSPDALSSLCMEAQIQEYKINKIVVENNTIEEWLYICMEGKCQVIRCLSEGSGEEEEEAPSRGRAQSLVLSEEIIELLSSASVARQTEEEQQEEEKSESSKEKLLSSLGLEYVATGKRRGAFIEEVEEEERRKALLASSGPMTLTSLMSKQKKEGKSGLVYVNVGSLESEDVFDMPSLIKAPPRTCNSTLLLVSSGARMLRMKKSVFLKLASPQAMEHTRTLVSKQPYPSEASILESYKRKVMWNAYKTKVVKEVVRSRELRSAPAYRCPKKKATRDGDSLSLERSKTSSRLLSALNRCSDAKKRNQTSTSSDPAAADVKESAPESPGDVLNATDSTSADAEVVEKPPTIFPVVTVDTKPDPDTPRSEASDVVPELEARPMNLPHATPYAYGVARPTAVIVRRRSSVAATHRSLVSAEATFVTRRRQDREDTSSNLVTRFSLAASDLDSASVAEES